MKKVFLYLLLLIAVPATAQPGLFGRGPHSHSRAISGQPCRGPLIKPGHSAHVEAQGMNPRDFEDAIRLINEENFDDKRLKLAKQIVSTNPMSSRQIANVCSLFNFETNRLEFAKFAYHHCVDPNRYFTIYEVFNFEASKDDLYKYIQEHNHQ